MTFMVSIYFCLILLGLKSFNENLEPLALMKIKTRTVNTFGGRAWWAYFQAQDELMSLKKS